MPFIAAPVLPATTLRVDASAPTLSAVRWIKGGPPTPGHVRVVEFWATWCAACRDGFPNLTRLAKRRGERVDVIGLDVWERRDASQKRFDFEPSVRAFVARQGGRMGYRVGMDQHDMVAKAWLDAAKSPGIPTAFVVDVKGRIAWIGHGHAVEDAVAAVLAGAKDPARAVAVARARREAIQARFNVAARRGDLESTLALRQDLPIDAPLDTAFRLLAAGDIAKARALAEAAIRDPKPGMWTYLELTWALLESGHRSLADGDLAVRLAQEGLRRADPSDESHSACLDYLADAYARKGDFARAADTTAQTIAILERESAKNAVDLKDARRQLDAYRAGQDPDARANPAAAATKVP